MAFGRTKSGLLVPQAPPRTKPGPRIETMEQLRAVAGASPVPKPARISTFNRAERRAIALQFKRLQRQKRRKQAAKARAQS